MKSYYLGADIGGTNSNLCLIEIFSDNFKILYSRNFETKKYDNIIDIINLFNSEIVNKYRILIISGVLAIAGQIEEDKIETPNVELKIDKKEIKAKTSLKHLEIINDFTAISYSVEKLEENQLKNINKSKSKNSSLPVLIIGAGTGLGKSIILQNKNIVLKSEGGHCDFAPQNKEEFELIEFIKKHNKIKTVEIEDLVSGKGIENIYYFLSKKHMSAKEISENKKKDKNCKKTFELFYIFYARACKNFALDIMTNEIYLAGGIITKNISFSKKVFMSEFTNSQNYQSYLKNISINIITDYNSSLIGLGNYILKNNNN